MKKIVSADELANIFSQIDVDGSGYIDYTEFIAATMDLKKASSEHLLERAFEKFDADGSGKISPQEVKDILGLTNEGGAINDKINKIIQQVDTNSDGEISFEEFKIMMQLISD